MERGESICEIDADVETEYENESLQKYPMMDAVMSKQDSTDSKFWTWLKYVNFLTIFFLPLSEWRSCEMYFVLLSWSVY